MGINKVTGVRVAQSIGVTVLIGFAFTDIPVTTRGDRALTTSALLAAHQKRFGIPVNRIAPEPPSRCKQRYLPPNDVRGLRKK